MSFGENFLKRQYGLNRIVFWSKFFSKDNMGWTIFSFGENVLKRQNGLNRIVFGENFLQRPHGLNRIVFWSKFSERITFCRTPILTARWEVIFPDNTVHARTKRFRFFKWTIRFNEAVRVGTIHLNVKIYLLGFASFVINNIAKSLSSIVFGGSVYLFQIYLLGFASIVINIIAKSLSSIVFGGSVY